MAQPAGCHEERGGGSSRNTLKARPTNANGSSENIPNAAVTPQATTSSALHASRTQTATRTDNGGRRMIMTPW